MDRTFRTMFWFPDKAESVIEKSNLPDSLKLAFKNAHKYGKTRSLSIMMKNKRDVDSAIELFKLRIGIKS